MTDLLHPARPIDPDVEVQRLGLVLPVGYETSVFRYRRAVDSVQTGRVSVLYLHGIQSHPGWFSASACHLAKAGHVVYQVTRRGSGCNERARGDAASADQLLDDLADACKYVLRDSGSDRLAILGVSWGGKLLCAFLARRPLPEAAAAVLVAPGIVPQVDVSLREKLSIAWSLLTGPGRLFNIPLSDVELFTQNPAMQDYLRSDPFRLHQATARFLFASRRLDRMIADALAGCIKIPTTLILSKQDRIIDNAQTRSVVTHLASSPVNVIEMPGQHTLEFEPEPGPFFEAIASSLTS